jgi:acetoin utilization protein AcuC
MPLAILYRPELREYDFGPGHPFRGDRYDVFPRFLRQNLPEDDNYCFLQAEPATETDLLLICDKEYIDITREYFHAMQIGDEYPTDFFRFQSSDNLPVGTPGKVEEAARLIIGQAKKACDLVVSGEFPKTVSIGGGMHHAKRRFGEGFCVYNDVAFCGLYLTSFHKLDRVLILDTDAHAGNGTTQYFTEDPHVLFIDLHQDPRTIYPGTGFANQIGSGAGKGFTVNVPFPEYAGDRSFKLAFEEIVEPLVREFQPQVIVRNGGSDPHFSDGLTSLGLTLDGFRMIGEKVRTMAKICNGKVVDLIASGYNRKILPYAWFNQITGLAGIDCKLNEPDPPPQPFETDEVYHQTIRLVDQVRMNLKDYWSCFQ